MPSVPAAQLTIGELPSNVPRALKWIVAVIYVSCLITVGFVTVREDPLFFTRVPWRLPLWISYVVYMSLTVVIGAYAGLFLPRTPVAVVEAFTNVGLITVGSAVGILESTVMPYVEDNRVLKNWTCVVAVLIVGLLAFWAWLVLKYGGQPADPPPKLVDVRISHI